MSRHGSDTLGAGGRAAPRPLLRLFRLCRLAASIRVAHDLHALLHLKGERQLLLGKRQAQPIDEQKRIKCELTGQALRDQTQQDKLEILSALHLVIPKQYWAQTSMARSANLMGPHNIAVVV